MARLLPHHLLAASLLLALLAGCGGKPPPGKYPDLTWNHQPPMKLKVEKIEIVREYQPRVTSPHVETLASRGLADSAERWAKDRLVADGDEGRLASSSPTRAWSRPVLRARRSGATSATSPSGSRSAIGTARPTARPRPRRAIRARYRER